MAAADDRPLKLLSLQHRSAEEILPLIRPFIAKDGVVQSAGDKLIVRTSNDKHEQQRTQKLQLDRPPRRLLIMVGQIRGIGGGMGEENKQAEGGGGGVGGGVGGGGGWGSWGGCVYVSTISSICAHLYCISTAHCVVC